MWTGTELLLLLVELPTEGRESVPSSGGLSLQLGDEVVLLHRLAEHSVGAVRSRGLSFHRRGRGAVRQRHDVEALLASGAHGALDLGHE